MLFPEENLQFVSFFILVNAKDFRQAKIGELSGVRDDNNAFSHGVSAKGQFLFDNYSLDLCE